MTSRSNSIAWLTSLVPFACLALFASLVTAEGPTRVGTTEADLGNTVAKQPSTNPKLTSAALRDELVALERKEQTRVSPGVFETIAYQLDVADRIEGDFAVQAEIWRKRARTLIDLTERGGEDAVIAQRGKILMRGYSSKVSRVRQGYAIYTPPNYDPKRAYPVMLALHGGSANGNLFLGVVLGNNMNWKEYDQHLWDDFTPRYSPDWIVVAPDGFGQVMWRFMGEQDVLDVLDDVKRHYNVDDDRVVLAGLSNGGVGAYNLGMRHAWRFSAVLAIAGAPSWQQYAGGSIDAEQARGLAPLSAMSLAENAINTDFRYYHGHVDPGPMRPAYVEEFSKHIAKLGVPYREKWFDAGHDLLYLVMRHGRIFEDLKDVRRNGHPSEVRIVTGDYRANRQHWVTVTRQETYPDLARVRARIEGERVVVETSNSAALALALKQAPLSQSSTVSIEVDGQLVFAGARSKLSEPVMLANDAGRWQLGEERSGHDARQKRPGSTGPITDAYYDGMVHVYGTADAAQTQALRKAAERGSRGWPLWLWRVQQPVLADTEVTDEIMRTHHLVLYGTPGANRVLTRIEGSLPIRLEQDAIRVGNEKLTAKGIGTKFIYPNPLASGRYVMVHAAPTIEGLNGAHNLPDFLPDYVVYDATTTLTRPRLLFTKRQKPLRSGYFNSHWQLTQRTARTERMSEGNDPESARFDRPKSRLGVPDAPPTPPVPTSFLAPETTAAGKAAREIARRVAKFTNYRSRIAGASWVVDDTRTWSIRDDETCMATLAEAGVSAVPWLGALPTPVPTPVRITAPVLGVTFRFMHAGAGVVLSCEMAQRLPAIASIVGKHGVHTVYVLSAYRDHPYTSFHTLGLALDISRFDGSAGVLDVKTHFLIDREHETCDAQVTRTGKAEQLRALACDLASSRLFSSVLTPNYNVGHRDHFHLDIPSERRTLVLALNACS